MDVILVFVYLKLNRIVLNEFAHEKIDELKHSWLICYLVYSKARIIIIKKRDYNSIK